MGEGWTGTVHRTEQHEPSNDVRESFRETVRHGSKDYRQNTRTDDRLSRETPCRHILELFQHNRNADECEDTHYWPTLCTLCGVDVVGVVE